MFKDLFVLFFLEVCMFSFCLPILSFIIYIVSDGNIDFFTFYLVLIILGLFRLFNLISEFRRRSFIHAKT